MCFSWQWNLIVGNIFTGLRGPAAILFISSDTCGDSITNLPEKVSRDMGYRSDSIAVSCDMGPLSYRRFLLRRYQKFLNFYATDAFSHFPVKEVSHTRRMSASMFYVTSADVVNCKALSEAWEAKRWQLMVCGWDWAIWKSPLFLTIMVASPWCRSKHPLSTKTREHKEGSEKRRPSPPAEALARDKVPDFTPFWQLPTLKLCEQKQNVGNHMCLKGLDLAFFGDPWLPIFRNIASSGDPSEGGLEFRVAVPSARFRRFSSTRADPHSPDLGIYNRASFTGAGSHTCSLRLLKLRNAPTHNRHTHYFGWHGSSSIPMSTDLLPRSSLLWGRSPTARGRHEGVLCKLMSNLDSLDSKHLPWATWVRPVPHSTRICVLSKAWSAMPEMRFMVQTSTVHMNKHKRQMIRLLAW